MNNWLRFSVLPVSGDFVISKRLYLIVFRFSVLWVNIKKICSRLEELWSLFKCFRSTKLFDQNKGNLCDFFYDNFSEPTGVYSVHVS